MKKLLFSVASCCLWLVAAAQSPIIYVNFVSHNEPGDNLQSNLNFLKTEPKVLQLADIMNSKGAAWNLETCDGMAKAALTIQGAASNVFRTIVNGVYSDNIEVDPRYKQTIYPNIADLYHILDSLGANPTHILGGFVYSTTDASTAPIDWMPYQDTVYGAAYPSVKWKCDLMYGAGSYPPHTDDLNDYGIWKPNTETDFYTHNPSNKTWFIGNGCQPLAALDSTENHQILISGLHSFLDSIQNGILPQDKFYAYTVQINQAHFGPTLFQMITDICDSINTWGSGIQWANLSEKLSAFEAWQISSGNDYSQWLCGQKVAGIEETENQSFRIYPNPSSGMFTLNHELSGSVSTTITDVFGRILYELKIDSNHFDIDLRNHPSGIYLLQIGGQTIRLLKE